LKARVVSERLNRRKIDLIPVDEWADLAPHSARLDAFVVPREL